MRIISIQHIHLLRQEWIIIIITSVKFQLYLIRLLARFKWIEILLIVLFKFLVLQVFMEEVQVLKEIPRLMLVMWGTTLMEKFCLSINNNHQVHKITFYRNYTFIICQWINRLFSGRQKQCSMLKVVLNFRLLISIQEEVLILKTTWFHR